MSDSEKKELAIREDGLVLGVLQSAGPVAVVQQATLVAKELARVVEDRKLYSVIQGKKFVRVEGWNTMGAMLGVVPREVSNSGDENGVYTAVVELVRVSDGQVIGRASAECGSDDEVDKSGAPTWAGRASYARRSMAATRATSKAFRLAFSWIMALAGYEVTPAEEMDSVIEGQYRTEPPKAPAPPDEERPYPPEMLKKRLGEIATYFQNKNAKASENLRNVLAGALDQAAGTEENRHALSSWLTGYHSTKDMPANYVHALLHWMEVESFSDKPKEMAVDEAIGALDFIQAGVD